MNRKEAKKRARDYHYLPIKLCTISREELDVFIDEIYDDFEQELQIVTSDKACYNCIHEPETPKECRFCKRFYVDVFEKKRG